MWQRPPGRPKKVRVRIGDLLAYLESLPELEQPSPDRFMIIARYVQELEYLDGVLKRLKADIDERGEVELFKQGKQQLRRVNPSVDLYFSTLRAYRLLLNKINDVLRGVEAESVW